MQLEDVLVVVGHRDDLLLNLQDLQLDLLVGRGLTASQVVDQEILHKTLYCWGCYKKSQNRC